MYQGDGILLFSSLPMVLRPQRLTKKRISPRKEENRKKRKEQEKAREKANRFVLLFIHDRHTSASRAFIRKRERKTIGRGREDMEEGKKKESKEMVDKPILRTTNFVETLKG
jgi:hypothetical protein